MQHWLWHFAFSTLHSLLGPHQNQNQAHSPELPLAGPLLALWRDQCLALCCYRFGCCFGCLVGQSSFRSLAGQQADDGIQSLAAGLRFCTKTQEPPESKRAQAPSCKQAASLVAAAATKLERPSLIQLLLFKATTVGSRGLLGALACRLISLGSLSGLGRAHGRCELERKKSKLMIIWAKRSKRRGHQEYLTLSLALWLWLVRPVLPMLLPAHWLPGRGAA